MLYLAQHVDQLFRLLTQDLLILATLGVAMVLANNDAQEGDACPHKGRYRLGGYRFECVENGSP